MIRFAGAFENPTGSPIRELFPYLNRPGMISFAGGYPSPALLDAAGLAEATARVFSHGGLVLQYGPTEGHPRLKAELAILLASRGIQASPQDQMLVTTGSQQAFDLLVRVLVQPGDTVLLESPAYPAAIQALRLANAIIVEVPMDSEGMQTSALEEVLRGMKEGSRPRLLYTVPTFSNPRGTLMPTSRRQALVALARRYDFLVIEDDPYGELAYCSESVGSLYAIGAQECGDANPVVYLSSLSKTVAPALRIGWMVAPEAVIRRCAIAKQTADLCTSPITQLIAAEYLHSGRYLQTLATARTEYGDRVQVLAGRLRSELGTQIRFQRPLGGMFLWAECNAQINPKRLFETSVENGVLFVPGSAFFPSLPASTCMRFSFATPDITEIQEGVRRLARAFDALL